MEIKINKKPKLRTCIMVCDELLDKKLDEYDLTHFINCHSTNLLLGKPRSGKTSLLYSYFQNHKLLKKVYHTVYLFQPSNSTGSMKDNIFGTLPEDQRFDELTYENLMEVMDRIKNEEPEFNNCIIFDDMSAFLKNNDTLKLFKQLIFNRRHLRTSIYFLNQTWFSVPKEIRRLFSNIFIFKTSKNEFENIFDEVVEHKKDIITDLMKLVYDKPYQYLFINTDSGRLFKGFDEIIIP